MKVRVGYGLGTAGLGDLGRFGDLVDGLEAMRFDSLWLSERLNGPAPDPLAALGVAFGRTQRLKGGMSVLVVPGRNPVVLAKHLASLDALSGGRLLPAVGLGAPDPREHAAFGVARGDRGSIFDEALPLMRRLWSGEPVDHHGRWFSFEGVAIGPRPHQDPLEVWLGGRAPAELRRVGRLGDGWLPSFTTPEEAARGREVVEEAAAATGRAVDPEHFGALVVYRRGPLPDRLAALVAARLPGADPDRVVPEGPEGARAVVEAFVAVGFSKFVLVPAVPPVSWEAELREVASVVLPLQT